MGNFNFITRPTESDLINWRGQIDAWPNSAKTMADDALNEIESKRQNCLAATSGTVLNAIASYYAELFPTAQIFEFAGNLPRKMQRLHIDNLGGNSTGGGSAIIYEMINRADAETVCLYLFSTAGAVSFYKKLGFRTINEDEFWYFPRKLQRFGPVI